MKYSKDVQDKIDVLAKYKETMDLKTFHIIHLYPKKVAWPDGYYDSRFFDLVCFNTKTMEKKTYQHHDGLEFPSSCNVDIVRIFADGSTMIRFKTPHEIIFCSQAVEIKAEKLDKWDKLKTRLNDFIKFGVYDFYNIHDVLNFMETLESEEQEEKEKQ